MRNLILLTTTLFCVSQALAEPELKGSPAELAAYLASLPKLVSVAGEAELKVPADRASVTLKVTTESKALQDALRLNQDVRAKMTAALNERGISPDKVQSSRFSSTPKHWVFSDKAKSYRIENLVKVAVQDDKEFNATALLVDRFPEVQFVSILFEHSDKEGLKKKALAQALDNASERKRVFEERLTVKLLPKSFSRADVALRTPSQLEHYRFAQKYDGASAGFKVGTDRTASLASGEAVGLSEEAGSLFGELIFTARVAVEYAVEK